MVVTAVAMHRPDVGILLPGLVMHPLTGDTLEVLIGHALTVLRRDHHMHVLGRSGASVVREFLTVSFRSLALLVAPPVGLLHKTLPVAHMLDLTPFALAGRLPTLFAVFPTKVWPAGDVACPATGALVAARGVGVGDVEDVGSHLDRANSTGDSKVHHCSRRVF